MPLTPKIREAVFLLNPIAGARRAEKIRGLAQALLPPAGILPIFVSPGSREAIVPAVRAALRRKAWAVVAVGGDGTVHPIAQALAGQPCRLGILPLGTGNGFARALGIPLNAKEALKVLALGHERRLDYAQVGREHGFNNVLGLGFDAWVAVAADELRWMNRFSGFLRYLAAGLRSLPKFKRNHLRLSLDREVVEGRFQLVAVANGPQYGFDFGIAPQARFDDGLLDVVCLRSVGPVDFLRNFVRSFKKEPLIGASYHRSRKVKIESLGAELPCHLEGEPGPWTPLNVTLRPRALRVITPL